MSVARTWLVLCYNLKKMVSVSCPHMAGTMLQPKEDGFCQLPAHGWYIREKLASRSCQDMTGTPDRKLFMDGA